MKNVLLIIQKLSNGGAEKAITNLANSLKNRYNLTMVVFDNSIKEYKPEVDIIDLKTPESKNILKKIHHFIIRIYKVNKIKKKLRIDCTISFLPGPNIVNVLSRYKDKTIISIRNIQSKLNKSKLRNLINQISFNKADRIIPVSEMVYSDLKKTYSINDKKVQVIYNLINLEQVQKKTYEKIDEKELLENELKIINIGRLIPQKGQWHLIKIFKKIQEKYPKAKLIILGRGDLESELKKLAKILKIEKNVIFLGFKENPYKYLYKSDIFISTSNFEGMSNVILEAMACGLPIIASDCLGGNREILYPDNGVLFPSLSENIDFSDSISNEENEVADLVINLFENKSKFEFYKIASKNRIKDFSIENIIEKWISVIEEI